MAVLALGFVGTAIGTGIGGTLLGVTAASIGGFIGASVGGLIDNMLFAGTNKVEGPRLKDLSVTASTYGSPIPLLYGPQNRLAGNVIWSTGLIETKNTESSGGKGGFGGGSKSTTYSYRTSVAVSLGEGRSTTFGTWPKLKRIWANGKLIFDLAKNAGLSPPNPIAAPDANVGMVATKANGTHAVFETLRFYQGTATQQIDPTVEAHLGVGDTPAFRHTMYAVIVDLQLADFGNVLPNLEFEVEADETISDAAIVRDICARAGEDLISASSLSDTRRGFIVSRPGTAASALEPLALVGAFDAADQRGQIRFVRRGLGMKATVPIADMGCRQADGAGGEGGGNEPIRFDRLDDLPLPQEVAFNYYDPALDFQVNSQRAHRRLGNSENNLSHEVAVTLTADEARKVADRLLWETWSARRGGRFAVSDRWARRNAADVVGLPVAGVVVPFKLRQMSRGANGIIEMEARFEDPEIYNSSSVGAEGTLPANELQLPGDTQLVLMDAPLLRQVDDDGGFYWAVSAANDGWRGAEVLRSSDGGLSYGSMAAIGVRAAIGSVASALPAGPADFWDRGNTLTVVLTYDEGGLESVSEQAVYSGANVAWLGPANGQGGEIIQFATATLTAPLTYDLSDLLRGRLGTEHAIGGHGAGEVFVLLDPNFVRRNDFGLGDWNRERLYKPVSILLTEADAAAQAFTNTGEAKRPRSVARLRARRQTLAGSPPDWTDDLTISWFRRSRIIAPGLGYGPLALGEESEAYEIDIVKNGAVVNTYAATSQSFLYTEARQSADGITLGAANQAVRVYQLSATRGRGHVSEIAI